MRKVVHDSFWDFTVAREGYTPFLYCDDLNLVTTGVGNLVDHSASHSLDTSGAAMAPALALPWKKRGPGWTWRSPVVGELATREEVVEAWTTVKLQDSRVPGFNMRGGYAYAELTSISLSVEDVKSLFYSTLASFEETLKKHFLTWESLPADAQLAVLSMAWACGPNFPSLFPAFTRSVNAGRFRDAAVQSYFRGGGGDPAHRSGRNAENQALLLSAAGAVEHGGDLDALHVPAPPGEKPDPPLPPLPPLGPSVSVDTPTIPVIVSPLPPKPPEPPASPAPQAPPPTSLPSYAGLLLLFLVAVIAAVVQALVRTQ